VDALTNIDLADTPMGVAVNFGPGNQAEGGFLVFQIQDGAFVRLAP
jgi:hypothetical protein